MAEGETPEEWASSCLVTDESQIGDFFSLIDKRTPEEVEKLGKELGFPVERRMYIWEVAVRMCGM